jgi:hypothetical protein
VSTLYTLLEQARATRAKLEQEHATVDTRGRVVIYNPETGEPLPGHEPNPHAEVNIWLPDKNRDEGH